MNTLLLALALLPGPQEEAAPPALRQGPTLGGQPIPPEGILVDSALAVVRDLVVTEADIMALVEARLARGRVASREDYERQVSAAYVERIDQLLQTQAGEDIGFPEHLISGFVDELFEQEVERQGSYLEASARFERARQTPAEIKRRFRETALARTWQSSVLGRGPGPTGRVTVDRYVRPGELHSFYQYASRDLRYAQRLGGLGGAPERVDLQSLVLPVDPEVGPQPALEQVEAIRELVASGEAEFTAMVRTYSVVPQDDGISSEVPLFELDRLSPALHGSDELARFCREAEPGALSRPFVGHDANRSRQGIYLYRLLERRPAEPMRFLEPEVQDALEAEVQRLLDDSRLSAAMQRLYRQGDIWELAAARERREEAEQAATEEQSAPQEPAAQPPPSGG